MQLHVKFRYSALLFTLFTLSHLQGVKSRTLATKSVSLADSTEVIKSKVAGLQNDTTLPRQDIQRSNASIVLSRQDIQRRNASTMATKSILNQTLKSTVVRHILREKRQDEGADVVLPFDFDTIHLPCDLDQNGRSIAVDFFPNHCRYVWRNRYNDEGHYRLFKTYQLEGFFFGQYFERLKRFETDPHTWDYGNTQV